MNKTIYGNESYQNKFAVRATTQFIDNYAVKYNNKTIGIASKTAFHYQSVAHKTSFLSQSINPKSYTLHNKHKSVLDYDANIYAIVSPYMNGTGVRDTSLRYTLMNLLNSES